jgi:hypothetical protein
VDLRSVLLLDTRIFKISLHTALFNGEFKRQFHNVRLVPITPPENSGKLDSLPGTPAAEEPKLAHLRFQLAYVIRFDCADSTDRTGDSVGL